MHFHISLWPIVALRLFCSMIVSVKGCESTKLIVFAESITLKHMRSVLVIFGLFGLC